MATKVSIFEVFIHLLYELLRTFLIALGHIHMACVLVVALIWDKIRNDELGRRKTPSSAISTDSGKDANAGVVGLLRFLYTFRPNEFPLDSNIRYFEYLFLSPLSRFVAPIIYSVPLFLDMVTDSSTASLAARTALIDHQIVDALKCQTATASSSSENSEAPANEKKARNFQQIIILGAGFDSRAYRFQELRKGAGGTDVWVIEVDQSVVQRKKVARLIDQLGETKFKSVTEGVEFVECNFEHPGALRTALLKSSKFDPSLSTFVLWEGVTYYLPKIAIQETLTTLSQLRSSGNRPEWKLVFDFLDEDVLLPTAPIYQRLMLRMVATVNAPFQFGLPLDIDQLNGFLGNYGVEVQRVWTFLTMVGEMFPKVTSAQTSTPMALAVCHWKANSA